MNTASTGIIRTCITSACRAWELRVSPATASVRAGSCASCARLSTAVRSTTSSPIRCISASSRSASTRTVLDVRFDGAAPSSPGLRASASASGAASGGAPALSSSTAAAATSGTAAMAAWSTSVSWSLVTQATTVRPSKPSTSSLAGTACTTAPWSPAAASTM